MTKNIFEQNKYLLHDLTIGEVENLAFMNDDVMFRKMARRTLPNRCALYKYNEDGIPKRIALKTSPIFKGIIKENKALAKGIKCWDCGNVFEDYSYAFSIDLKEGHGLTYEDLSQDRHWDLEINGNKLEVNPLESFDDIDDEIQEFIKDNSLEEYTTSYSFSVFCPSCLVCM